MSAHIKKIAPFLWFIYISTFVFSWLFLTDKTLKSAGIMLGYMLVILFLLCSCLWNHAAIVSLNPITRRKRAAAIFTVIGVVCTLAGVLALAIEPELFSSEIIGVFVGIGIAGVIYAYECEEGENA